MFLPFCFACIPRHYYSLNNASFYLFWIFPTIQNSLDLDGFLPCGGGGSGLLEIATLLLSDLKPRFASVSSSRTQAHSTIDIAKQNFALQLRPEADGVHPVADSVPRFQKPIMFTLHFNRRRERLQPRTQGTQKRIPQTKSPQTFHFCVF